MKICVLDWDFYEETSFSRILSRIDRLDTCLGLCLGRYINHAGLLLFEKQQELLRRLSHVLIATVIPELELLAFGNGHRRLHYSARASTAVKHRPAQDKHEKAQVSRVD